MKSNPIVPRTAFRRDGIYTALWIPADSEGRLLKQELQTLVAFQKKQGVHGILALGSTGEFPHFSPGGSVLLFLHADTVLPEAAPRAIIEALKPLEPHPPRVWGRFDVAISGLPAMLRVVAWSMNLRSRLTGIATGDQAIFMTRAAFEAAGGFLDQPLMEDIELCRRLKRVSPPVCLRAKVITSGRRWEERGVWRTIFLMWRLRLAYFFGASPEYLAARYR